MPGTSVHPWVPISSPIDLKHLGKLGEELGECNSAVSRCIIQGVNEEDPETKKVNLLWLAEEMADVIANVELNIEHFNIDPDFIQARVQTKKGRLRRWHAMLNENN